MTISLRPAILAACSLISLTNGASALAQEVADESEGNSDEIVVTAQKREQSAQDVGISMAVLGGDTLEERHISVGEDLSKAVPGLEISANNGPGTQPSIYLRGVGLNDFNTNNSGPIAVYADETYKSSFIGQSAFFYDVERVEVLKGPQGTLFGRNATGGAIRIIARKPGKHLGFEGSASYARFNTTQFEAAANLPLADAIRMRFSGIKADSDGYMHDVALGTNRRGYNFVSGRGELAVDFSPDANLLLTAQYDDYKGNGAGYKFQGTLDPATMMPCTDAQVIAMQCVNPAGYGGEAGLYTIANDRLQVARRKVGTYSGVFNWELDGVTITSATSFEHATLDQQEDTDASPLRVLEADFGVKSDTFEQELRFSYEGDRFKGTFGGFYLHEKLDQDQRANVFPMFRPLIASIDPIAYPDGFDPTGSAIGIPVLNGRFVNTQKTDVLAIFGQGQYSLTDTFRLIGGLRYGAEKRTFLTNAALEEPTFTLPLYSIPLKVDGDNWSYKAGFEWDARDDTMVYASVSTGYKSGGFNGGFLLDPNQVVPFNPEKLTAYEVGVKNNFRSAGLMLNAAAFYYDYKDIQVFTFVNIPGGLPTTLLTNAADARIWGVEGDFRWKPVQGLTVSGAASYLNSKFKRFTTAATLGAGNFTGNRLALTPEFSGNVRLDYETPVGTNLLARASLGVNWKSKVFFDPSNRDVYSQKGYALADASFGIGAEDDKWSLSVFATNLLDKKYLSYALDLSSFGFNQQSIGEPRVIGARVSIKF